MKYVRALSKTVGTMAAVALIFWGFMWVWNAVSIKTGFIVWGTMCVLFFGGLLFARFLDAESK